MRIITFITTSKCMYYYPRTSVVGVLLIRGFEIAYEPSPQWLGSVVTLPQGLILVADPNVGFGDRGESGSEATAADAALALEEAVPCINLEPEPEAGIVGFVWVGLTGVVTV